MSVAYDTERWHDLFVATGGATAALLGLLFVAVSINLDRILSYPGLPERALETLLLLLSVLIVSIVCLMPQGHVALGLELLGVTASVAWIVLRLPVSPPVESDDTPTQPWLSRVGVRLMGTLPAVVGALSVLFAAGGGLYWIVAGVVLAIVGAVANAWVLLVEILR